MDDQPSGSSSSSNSETSRTPRQREHVLSQTTPQGGLPMRIPVGNRGNAGGSERSRPSSQLIPEGASSSGGLFGAVISASPDFFSALPSAARNRAVSTPIAAVRDYFAPQPDSNPQGTPRGTPRGRRDREQWTVFGQLLEDEFSPVGTRGSETPGHTLRPRRSRTASRLRPVISSSSSYSSLLPPSHSIELSETDETFDTIRGKPNGLEISSTTGEDPNNEAQPDRFENMKNDPVSLNDSFSESDEETDDTTSEVPSVPGTRSQGSTYNAFSFLALSPLQKNVLKCSLAYFIGSLFTFVPALSNLISDIVPIGGPNNGGPSPSGHMVATIAVYYNPAKTMGAMVEADVYCLVAALYSAAVCLLSMGLFWFFENQGYELAADTMVFLCLGLGMSFVAWMKLRMAKPSFNTACSMTAITIFIVIVKEGGAQTLLHVLFIVFIGSVISNSICFVLWPQSATTNLQVSMVKVIDSFATLLDMTTQTFLLQEDYKLRHGKLLRAVEEHQSSFVTLKKNLQEAKSEWCDQRIKGSSKQALYEDVIDSLNRLAQHLNGMRDGTRQQVDLASQIDTTLVHGSQVKTTPDANISDHVQGESAESVNAGFVELLNDVKPPMEALSNRCLFALKHVKAAFSRHNTSGGVPSPEDLHSFRDLANNINRALFTFQSTSNRAVLKSFAANINARHENQNSAKNGASNDLMMDAKDNEPVFVIYFFLFILQEFAREIVVFVDLMSGIYEDEQALATHRGTGAIAWFKRQIFCCIPGARPRSPPTANKTRPTIRKRISTLLPTEPRSKVSPFPRVRPHAPNTIHTPARATLPFYGRVKQSFWFMGRKLKDREFRFAIKTGLATAILAAPAFIDRTRPLFMAYRGEWSLISFFVVMSPTIGATNFLSLHRILGTLIGAVTAAGAYTIFPDNPYGLSAVGFLFSIPCFYIIVGMPKYATSGRFLLLTYNLTALFCYNLRDTPSVEPVTIAFRRSVSVIVGVVWAFVVSRWWWPSEARRELSKSLSEFCLNLGWLYTRLVETYSVPPEALSRRPTEHEGFEDPQLATEGSPLLRQPSPQHINSSIRRFMAMELHLQIKLIEMQELLAQTQNEPRLKGPFPTHLYRTVLTSLQVMLDKLHSMRCVTTREEWYSTVRNSFIIPVNPQRREMVGNIILYFSILSSAFITKRGLPPYLPPAEKSRLRLVEAIRNLDVVKNRNVQRSHHLLYFAYAMTMKGVTQELDFLGHTLQEAFGVIGQSVEDFESFFLAGNIEGGGVGT